MDEWGQILPWVLDGKTLGARARGHRAGTWDTRRRPCARRSLTNGSNRPNADEIRRSLVSATGGGAEVLPKPRPARKNPKSHFAVEWRVDRASRMSSAIWNSPSLSWILACVAHVISDLKLTLLVLNLSLHVVDGVRRLDLEGDGLARDCGGMGRTR